MENKFYMGEALLTMTQDLGYNHIYYFEFAKKDR